MSHDNPRSDNRRWLAPLLWVGGSFLLFFVLFFDPLGIHPVDSWLQRVVGYGTKPMPATAPPDPRGEVLFYRNPMDPTVTSPVPAQDEMGMDYIPVYAEEQPMADGGKAKQVLFYRNPMDPSVTSPVPTQDSMGMDYIPVYADTAQPVDGDGTTVAIDPVVVQNMNVQSAVVERRDLSHEIRTVGYVEYDQERMVSVTTKYSGWVETVYVNYVGEPVRRGQPLFEIYSPELVQTQQELLSALSYAQRLDGAPGDARQRAQGLVDAARSRLGYWDISEEQVTRLVETRQVQRTLTVVAPTDGVVMMRMPGLEGMAVAPGMEIFHIADLSSLWLSVEIFEDQVAWVREGTPAQVAFTYFPGETFRGKVRFIDPEFAEKTRTLRVKLAVPNAGGKLRPGMFATVTFLPLAAHDVVTIPTLAILRTGERDVIVVDLGNGRFEPREVSIGHETRGFAEVLAGVEPGERVVTSAQFLIDSEASLQEAIQRMVAQRKSTAAGSHAAHEPPPTQSDGPQGKPQEPGDAQ